MKIQIILVFILISLYLCEQEDDCKPQGVKLSLADNFDKSTNYDKQLLLKNIKGDYSVSYYTILKCQSNYIQIHNDTINIKFNPQNITYFSNQEKDKHISIYIHNYLIDVAQLKMQAEKEYNYTIFYQNMRDKTQQFLSKGPFQFYHHGDLTKKQFKFGWVADLDVTKDSNGNSVGLKNIDIISNFLKQNQSEFVAILGGGDYTYKLENNNGTVGFDFMNQTEKLFSKIPLVAVAGNHEANFPKYDFKYFQGFFRNPRSYVSNSEYYSISLGRVLLIGLNTNYYDIDKSNKKYIDGQMIFHKSKIEQLTLWVDFTIKELKDQYDWIIVFSHVPIYCTDMASVSCQEGADKLIDLQDVMLKHKVDVYISGHLHNYERIHPIYKDNLMLNQTNECKVDDCIYYFNPQAPIYVTDGTAGNTYWFNNTDGYQKISNMSVINDSKLGFSYFTLLSENELEFRHYRTDPIQLFDSFVIKKDLKRYQKQYQIEYYMFIIFFSICFLVLSAKIVKYLIQTKKAKLNQIYQIPSGDDFDNDTKAQ